MTCLNMVQPFIRGRAGCLAVRLRGSELSPEAQTGIRHLLHSCLPYSLFSPQSILPLRELHHWGIQSFQWGASVYSNASVVLYGRIQRHVCSRGKKSGGKVDGAESKSLLSIRRRPEICCPSVCCCFQNYAILIDELVAVDVHRTVQLSLLRLLLIK